MLLLLAAAWAVGTAKLIAETTHPMATATTAGDHMFLFVKYDTLPPLRNARTTRCHVANSHSSKRRRQGG
jgi:hypothetical protein